VKVFISQWMNTGPYSFPFAADSSGGAVELLASMVKGNQATEPSRCAAE
jgi:hypothetical protein